MAYLFLALFTILSALIVAVPATASGSLSPLFNDYQYPNLDRDQCIAKWWKKSTSSRKLLSIAGGDREDEKEDDDDEDDDDHKGHDDGSVQNTKCEECTDSNVGTQGYYVVPLNGRCTASDAVRSSSKIWCYNSVSKTQCCKNANQTRSAYWMHYVNPNTLTTSCGNAACGICYMFPANVSKPECVTRKITVNGKSRLNSNASTVGKNCGCWTKNDPHFLGAQGTRFEFNGLPEQSFCLLTDRRFHVNMKMRGYYDERTVGASVLHNGKAVRTWIRELGFVWLDVKNQIHSLRLVARDGKSQTRDSGFLKAIEFDGRALSPLKLGGFYSLAGAILSFSEETKEGGVFDVDVYQLSLGSLDLTLRLRVAHPLLQTPNDAEAHFNVMFGNVEKTADIHGVMGQTFRDGRERRSMDYSALSQLLGRPVAADGASGAGFLDGDVKDYLSSDVLTPDCAFSAFNGHQMPEVDNYTHGSF